MSLFETSNPKRPRSIKSVLAKIKGGNIIIDITDFKKWLSTSTVNRNINFDQFKEISDNLDANLRFYAFKSFLGTKAGKDINLDQFQKILDKINDCNNIYEAFGSFSFHTNTGKTLNPIDFESLVKYIESSKSITFDASGLIIAMNGDYENSIAGFKYGYKKITLAIESYENDKDPKLIKTDDGKLSLRKGVYHIDKSVLWMNCDLLNDKSADNFVAICSKEEDKMSGDEKTTKTLVEFLVNNFRKISEFFYSTGDDTHGKKYEFFPSLKAIAATEANKIPKEDRGLLPVDVEILLTLLGNYPDGIPYITEFEKEHFGILAQLAQRGVGLPKELSDIEVTKLPPKEISKD